jgi:putative two-component system response regulator
MSKIIFVVDDSDTNLTTAEAALEQQYRVMTLPSAVKMFTLLEKVTPDLILLDIEMPGIDGFDALQRLKAHPSYADIPVIFLTGMTDAAVEARGFELGVTDFIAKPFSASVLLNRIKTHLNIDALIRERTMQLRRLQNGIVYVLADIIEKRDLGTGGHIERTTGYIRNLIDTMLARGVYADELRGWDMDMVVASARLHDVGKITIPDSILNKPGLLTPAEFETMKMHTVEGERIIEQIITRTGDEEFLRNAKLFAGYHHEYWDGTGYPHGLQATAIPLQGRVMAVVDVYDALVSARPYKGAFSNKEALSIILGDAGRRFDPKIAEVFCTM